MKACRYCGSLMPDISPVCPNCGNLPSDRDGEMNAVTILGIAGFALIIIAIALIVTKCG